MGPELGERFTKPFCTLPGERTGELAVLCAVIRYCPLLYRYLPVSGTARDWHRQRSAVQKHVMRPHVVAEYIPLQEKVSGDIVG